MRLEKEKNKEKKSRNAIHRFLKRTKQSDAYNQSKCNVNDICSNIFIRAVANGTKCLYVHFVGWFLFINFLSLADIGVLDDRQFVAFYACR